MLTGGDSGPAIVPGEPETSILIELVASGDMPPGPTRLKDEQIELLREWIRTGAQTLRPEPESIGPGIPITEQERSYWAYQPLRKIELPRQVAADRIRTGLDALIDAAMGLISHQMQTA